VRGEKMNKWTKNEIKLVEKLKSEGKSIREIANILSKSYEAVAHKYRNFQIESPIQSKKEKVNLSALIIQSLKDELLNVKPYQPAIQSKIDVKGDTLVIHITDLHAGKIVKDQEGKLIYNEDIFRKRINCLCEQTLKLLDNNISKGVPIIDVVILLTGDLANGEDIYATQAYEQELAPPKQVMLVVDVITKLITSLLKRNLSVKVYGIRGNHGRTGKDTDVASNWDIMIYEILDFWAKLVLKNPKLQIKFAETEHLKFDIRGHGFLIRHICPEQPDTPAGRVKINQWARQYNVEGICYGHYHHAGVFDCDNVRVMRGGSTVGGDSLSDSMAKNSEPIQLIFGVNEARVTTFIYLVDLAEKK
jgi:predicted phosphodiesterase